MESLLQVFGSGLLAAALVIIFDWWREKRRDHRLLLAMLVSLKAIRSVLQERLSAFENGSNEGASMLGPKFRLANHASTAALEAWRGQLERDNVPAAVADDAAREAIQTVSTFLLPELLKKLHHVAEKPNLAASSAAPGDQDFKRIDDKISMAIAAIESQVGRTRVTRVANSI